MARGSKVGGTKRRIKDAVGFLVIIALFLLYMIPFLMVLINLSRSATLSRIRSH